MAFCGAPWLAVSVSGAIALVIPGVSGDIGCAWRNLDVGVALGGLVGYLVGVAVCSQSLHGTVAVQTILASCLCWDSLVSLAEG